MKKPLITTIFSLALAGTVTASQAEEIVVGGKGFTEQLILTSMTVQYLEGLGYEVEENSGMGSTILRQAQLNGQIDLYWEYTGTSLITYNKVTEDLSAEETYQRVKELDAEKGLVWLAPSEANNTYALAMRADDAKQREIESISDLAETINGGETMTLASNAEFYARDDGLRPMQETYGFEFGRANVKRMDFGLTLPSLADGNVDVAMATATDGRIPAFDLMILNDDKGYFPAYALTPVVREETLAANPELGKQLNEISELLNDQVMATLNARVDVDKDSVERVAEDFLREHDLL